MSLFTRLRLAWYWLRSRYAVPNAFVRCSTCPNWLRHSRVKVEIPVTDPALLHPDLFHDAGLCKLDRPRVFNDFTTGYALKIWTGNDSCARHPLYDAKIVQGSDLEYKPGDGASERAAGFSRLPTLAEALRMSGASRVKPGENVPARPARPQLPDKGLGYRIRPYFTMGNEPENEPETKKE